MSPISCQSLNGATLGSRGPIDSIRGNKEGKSSEFNPQNDEQVKSSPATMLWSHEGSKPKNGKHIITKIRDCGAKFRHGYDPGVVVLA